MMVSPRVSAWNRLIPRRFRIAACVFVRYLWSSSLVADWPVGKKCLKTNSLELSWLPEYLPVISRCGFVAKGYGKP